MLSSVEQVFVGRDEKQAPLKTPAWEAMIIPAIKKTHHPIIVQNKATCYVLIQLQELCGVSADFLCHSLST